MSEPESAYDQLYHRHKAFVDAYLECGFNATEAARQVNYSNPNVYGPTLVNRSEIEAAIEERMAESTMSANEVLKRLDEQARADLSEFLTEVEVDTEEGTETRVQIDMEGLLDSPFSHLVKEINWTKYGPKIRVHDQQEALKLLGKAHGLFKQRHEHSGPGGGPVRHSLQWADPEDAED